MPYRWTDPDPETRCLILRPHRSLTARGFVWFVGGTAALIALPLVAVLGSPVMWGSCPSQWRRSRGCGGRSAAAAATGG
jgi:hypothetical protein